jgi:hypothetical protein
MLRAVGLTMKEEIVNSIDASFMQRANDLHPFAAIRDFCRIYCPRLI